MDAKLAAANLCLRATAHSVLGWHLYAIRAISLGMLLFLWTSMAVSEAVLVGDRTVYYYGSEQAQLICRTHIICTLELEEGEQILYPPAVGNKLVWDAWVINNPVRSYVQVTPKVDSGELTNLTVTTNKRIYNISLVNNKLIPATELLSFRYPLEQQKNWQTYTKYASGLRRLETGALLTELDFNFQLSGDNPKWKPIRVYRKGGKSGETVIELPSKSDVSPIFLSIDESGQYELIRYKQIGNRILISRFFEQGLLLEGVGKKQKRVYITRSKK